MLASYTNENLDHDNGQYFDGVTDDGLILFRDGPRMDQLYPRIALMDPATGEKDWLPDLDIGQAQTWPVELSTDRLVLLSAPTAAAGARAGRLRLRPRRPGSGARWTGRASPRVELPQRGHGPGRPALRLRPGHPGQPPEGGWPTGPDGEAEDADAEGDTYDLWSVSLTDSDRRPRRGR